MKPRVLPPEESCERKLWVIGGAIERYRAETGPLPQTVVGPTGFKRSWRVLLAPYLGEFGRRFDYRPEEPWDSPHNQLQFRNWPLTVYMCHTESRTVPYPYTSYLMLVRTDSAGLDEEDRSASPLPDDAVLIVESVDCHVKCGEPKDIDFESLLEGDSPFGVGKLNSHHPGVVKALRVDGKVVDIPKDITKDRLRELLSGTVVE